MQHKQLKLQIQCTLMKLSLLKLYGLVIKDELVGRPSTPWLIPRQLVSDAMLKRLKLQLVLKLIVKPLTYIAISGVAFYHNNYDRPECHAGVSCQSATQYQRSIRKVITAQIWTMQGCAVQDNACSTLMARSRYYTVRHYTARDWIA